MLYVMKLVRMYVGIVVLPIFKSQHLIPLIICCIAPIGITNAQWVANNNNHNKKGGAAAERVKLHVAGLSLQLMMMLPESITIIIIVVVTVKISN
jgi:hypothetical protein